ncbi:hypothetical protein [Staphylococcus hyicus]|uniref:hypothetical protein n=1 Tax=Staphylococcus hyicus TaxID=1284 RepID=UPI0014316E66|nr:hypothetical protein [Staphylococcus hyicus]MCQ9301432.1 hypothetical protein [Staphylococcus hyicus]MDP4448485.1 hypothetical protein [Staphylococcus hyicus]MDP4460722.1 hypothetical protein [Staphylococcus hyicus]MDP4469274.1 hypothetical protein [Staphylococcus hyicus]
MYQFNNSKVLKGSLAIVITTGLIVSSGVTSEYSYAKETNVTHPSKKSSGEIVKLNDNTARIDLNKGIDFTVDKNGVATLKDVNTGKKEILPSTAKDKNGKNVTLIYYEKGGKLGVYVQKAQEDRGIGKCVSGIAGGAVTGGTTLGLAGAGVGTVTLPLIGTVGGGVVGAVGGAVGGGLTGGATFC